MCGDEVIFVPETTRTLEGGWPQPGAQVPSPVHLTHQPGGSKAISKEEVTLIHQQGTDLCRILTDWVTVWLAVGHRGLRTGSVF